MCAVYASNDIGLFVVFVARNNAVNLMTVSAAHGKEKIRLT